MEKSWRYPIIECKTQHSTNSIMKLPTLLGTIFAISLSASSCIHVATPDDVSGASIGAPLQTSRFAIATPKGQKWSNVAGTRMSVGPVVYVLSHNPARIPNEQGRKVYHDMTIEKTTAGYRKDGWTMVSKPKLRQGNPSWITSKWRDDDGEPVTSYIVTYFGKRTAIVHALVSGDGSDADARRVLSSYREK